VKLPEKIGMQRTAMTDGAHGGAAHYYRSITIKYGVEMMSVRMNRDAKFTQSWTSEALPGEEFSTYPELRKAVNNLK